MTNSCFSGERAPGPSSTFRSSTNLLGDFSPGFDFWRKHGRFCVADYFLQRVRRVCLLFAQQVLGMSLRLLQLAVALPLFLAFLLRENYTWSIGGRIDAKHVKAKSVCWSVLKDVRREPLGRMTLSTGKK